MRICFWPRASVKMKTALLLLAAVSWAAATEISGPPKVFSPNREYRYEYESQILTGIPTLNSQYSGLKVKARAVMHIAPDYYVTLKLTNIEVYEVIEEAGVIPTTMVPDSLLQSIPSEHSTDLIESLVIPVKFRYTTGLVTKVYAQDMDPYWSVNIKRGVISLMNLDLNAENPVAVDSSISRSFMGVVSSDYSTMSAKTAYKVIEPSTLGDCETFYNMVPIPSMSEMIVSKVVDTKRCAPKVMGEWGLFSGIMSGRNTSEMNKLIHPSVSVDYVLSGSRHEFLIKSAVLVGKYVVSASTKDLTSMDGYVLQKLVYVKDEPIDRPITFTSTPVPLKKGLHAYIPLQSLVKKEARTSLSMGEGRLERAKIDMVDGLMERIIEMTVSKVEKEVPDMVSTIVSILRTLSKDELMHVVKKYCRTDVSGETSLIAKKKTLILDILPTLPHPDVPLILVRLVKEEYISGVYAGALINIATLVSTPSPVMVNELIELAKAPEIIREPSIHRAVILGVGTLSSKLVYLHSKMGLSPMRTSGWIKNIVKEMKELLETSDSKTKIIIVKAIGNAGVVEFIPDIERLIKDLSLPKVIRAQAVFALRKLATIEPRVVRSILLPVYMDPSEPEEIRVAAFLMIMETKPEFGTLQMVGHSLNSEPSVQVASFVYSYLQNMARTSIPDLKPIGRVAKRILLSVKPIIVSPLVNSKSIKSELFCQYAQVGTDFTINKIHTTNTALPSVIVSKMYAFIFGKSVPIFEVGAETEGMDEIVRKLVGAKGVLSDIIMGRTDVKKILEPLTRIDMGSVEREISRILTESEIPEPKATELRIASFLRIFGNEVNFFSLGREDVIEIIKSVKSSSVPMDILNTLITGYNVDILKAIPVMDNAIVLPTPMGLPISFNLSAVSVVTVKGQIKIDGITHVSSMLSSIPSKLAVDVRAIPSARIKIYQTLGIAHDIIKIGTTVKRSIAAELPTAFRVELDTTKEKVEIMIGVPKEMVPKVEVSVIPGLFKHFVPIKLSSYSSSVYSAHIPTIVPISCENVLKTIPIKEEYTVPIVGMKAKVEGIITFPRTATYESVLLLSRQEVSVEIEPTYGAPDAVKIEIIYGKRETVVRSSSDGWFSWMSSSQVEDEVAVDEFVPVTPNTIIPSPAKKQIFVNVLTVGGYHDAKIKTKLTLIHDPSLLLHQINCQVVGSNIIIPVWKVKIDSVLDISKVIKLVIEPSHLSSIDTLISTDLSFGTNSFTENTIITKVLPSHTRIPSTMVPASISEYVAPVKSINVKIEVNIVRTSETIRSVVVPWCKLSRNILKSYLYTMEASPSSSEDNVEIILNIVPQLRKIDAIISAPNKKLTVYGIPIPQVWPFLQPIIPPSVHLKRLPMIPEITTLTKAPVDIASAFYGSCIVTPTNVTTIANSTMPLPEISPSCEIVLAHDCSPQRIYTVVSTPITVSGARKVKVIIPRYEVEVSRSVIHEGVIVTVNGEVRRLPSRGALNITEVISGKTVPVIKIIELGRKHIIEAPQVGIVVETDGVSAEVKVSPLLMSSACGLCAHVPKIPIIRRSVSRVSAAHVSSMPPVSRFIVKSEECEASGRVSYNTGSLCEVTSRNAKITRVSEGVAQVCFSVRPIPTCAGFCSPASTVSESVGFTCLPANDYTARTLSTDVTERVLTELSNRMVHTYEPIMVPTQCVA